MENKIEEEVVNNTTDSVVKSTKKKNVLKKILMIAGITVGAVVLVFLVYVGYVFGTYSRIEDNQPLEAEGAKNLPAAEAGKEYTIVSQNFGFGAYTQDFSFFMDGGTESRAKSKESVEWCIDEAIELLSSFNPDFIIFQEVDTDSTRAHHVNQKEAFINSFGGYSAIFAENYHSAYLFYPFLEPHGKSNSGILTLSDKEITGGLRRSLPISTSFSKILDLDRCYSISRIPVDNGKELIIINVHLSAYTSDPAVREGQTKMLFDDMKKEYEAGNYVIVGGDFNHDFTTTSAKKFNPDTEVRDWASPFPAEDIPDGFSQALDYNKGADTPTCRDCDAAYSPEQYTVILDGFITSDNIEVNYLENYDNQFTYSDHNPVIMKFELK